MCLGHFRRDIVSNMPLAWKIAWLRPHLRGTSNKSSNDTAHAHEHSNIENTGRSSFIISCTLTNPSSIVLYPLFFLYPITLFPHYSTLPQNISAQDLLPLPRASPNPHPHPSQHESHHPQPPRDAAKPLHDYAWEPYP